MVEYKKNSNGNGGKPPNRLQRQAPGGLDLGGDVNPLVNSGVSHCAIPLLSPLVLVPQPLPEVVEDMGREGGGDDRRRQEKGKGGGSCPASAPAGWQHPAMAGLKQPLSLFSLFQSHSRLHNTQPIHAS